MVNWSYPQGSQLDDSEVKSVYSGYSHEARSDSDLKFDESMEAKMSPVLSEDKKLSDLVESKVKSKQK